MIEGDCLKELPKLKEKSIDLIITDLPYGKTKNKWDKIIPFEKMWKEVERVTKDNAAIIFFSQGIFYVDLVNSNRKNFRYDIIWDKVLVSGHLNAGKMPLRSHEQLAVFYKKLPTYNPQFTEGIPLHSVGKTSGTTVENGEKMGIMVLLVFLIKELVQLKNIQNQSKSFKNLILHLEFIRQQNQLNSLSG